MAVMMVREGRRLRWILPGLLPRATAGDLVGRALDFHLMRLTCQLVDTKEWRIVATFSMIWHGSPDYGSTPTTVS
uniref:Putative secreted protein n=1 Tax=Anopheles triannulatus TaxID=58253 RepID=A0A2M4B6C8_9DIPT